VKTYGTFVKALRIYNDSAELRCEDVPEPQLLSDNDVLVAIKAAALSGENRIPHRGSGTALAFPQVIGRDGAGVVCATGTSVRNIAAGDRVILYPANGCGSCSFCMADKEIFCPNLEFLGETRPGTCAEYVTAPGRNCFRIPDSFSFQEAATLGSALIRAWRMVVTDGQLVPGVRVLIRGIGRPTAIAALQIALHLKARTIVTSRHEAHLRRAQELGAEHGILEKPEFDKTLRALTEKRGVDLAIDCMGGEYWSKTLACLSKGGRAVTCAAWDETQPATDLRRIFWNNLSVFGSRFGSRDDFFQALRFVHETGTKPVIAAVLPLEDATGKFEILENETRFGTSVLAIG
jgi:D-arabinose 1-dehydrogenase-like Zn-dependent alcohol dehydrogenase